MAERLVLLETIFQNLHSSPILRHTSEDLPLQKSFKKRIFFIMLMRKIFHWRIFRENALEYSWSIFLDVPNDLRTFN